MWSALLQLRAAIGASLWSLPQRWRPACVALAGLAGAVAVVAGLLSIAAGFERVLQASGKPDSAVVLRAGSRSEITSELTLEDARIVAQAPGVSRSSGRPAASPELFVAVEVERRGTGDPAQLPLRGVGSEATQVRPDFEIVEGRMLVPGRAELVVGAAAAARFADLDIGSTRSFGNVEWTVVGLFSTDGTAAESEIWSDAALLQSAYRREGTYHSVHVRLDDAESFVSFEAALLRDPRLQVSVQRETDYYAEQSVLFTRLVRTVGAIVAVLLGICATFAALNAMYSLVAARAHEVATLRAIGFFSSVIGLSVLVEACVLAVAAAALGCSAAALVFDGYEASTLNWRTYTQIAFTFELTPGLLVLGTAYSLVLGLLGGLLPAVQAARVPPAQALRGT